MVTRLQESYNLCSNSDVKSHEPDEVTQAVLIGDYVREIIVKKLHSYGEYGSLEPLLFLPFFFFFLFFYEY